MVNSEIVIENGRSTRGEESELFAQAEILAKRAWDNWPSRDWGARRVDQIILPPFLSA